MKVVYATSTFTWASFLVRTGQHWPVDDPVVKANPGSFSEDPRTGLSYSVEPAVNGHIIERRERVPKRG